MDLFYGKRPDLIDGRVPAIIERGPKESIDQYIERLLSRFDEHSPLLREMYEVGRYWLKYKGIFWHQNRLEERRDMQSFGFVDKIPSRCILQTAARFQIDLGAPFHVDQQIFDHRGMSATSQAVLFLHEAIYYVAAKYMGHQTSSSVIRLVSWLIKADEEIDPSKLQRKLSRLNFGGFELGVSFARWAGPITDHQVEPLPKFEDPESLVVLNSAVELIRFAQQMVDDFNFENRRLLGRAQTFLAENDEPVCFELFPCRLYWDEELRNFLFSKKRQSESLGEELVEATDEFFEAAEGRLNDYYVQNIQNSLLSLDLSDSDRAFYIHQQFLKELIPAVLRSMRITFDYRHRTLESKYFIIEPHSGRQDRGTVYAGLSDENYFEVVFSPSPYLYNHLDKIASVVFDLD